LEFDRAGPVRQAGWIEGEGDDERRC
jgi:hypothetical protein